MFLRYIIMKPGHLTATLAILFAKGLGFTLHAQCSGGTSGGILSPAPATTTQTMAVSNGNYYTFSVPASACKPVYLFSFCSADGGSNSQTDTQITIQDNNGTATSGGYNDDACGTLSRLTWSPTSTVAATYRILVNRYNCTTGGTGVLAYNVINTYTNTAEYTVIGSSAYASGCTTVTPNSPALTGCAWDVNSTLSFASNWTYDFRVNLGANDAGADGMAFVMHNDPRGRCACGSNGGGLAAGGISNSLILEIDTYINYEDRDDFANPVIGCLGTEDPDHLDLWLNGMVNPNTDNDCNSLAAGERPVIPNAVRLQNPPGTNYNIENGMDHILRVSWAAGSPGTFTARILNTALTITYATISTTLNPIAAFGTTTPYFGFTGSTGVLSNQQSFCSPPVLLPVQLLYLDAECGEKGIMISWATASEVNNKHFDILRSDDGIHYTSVGQVNGTGNTNSKVAYSYSDESVLPGIVYYYRLRQVDFSGSPATHDFTANSALSCGTSNIEVIVFPNPADKAITINFGIASKADIELYNAEGQLVYFFESGNKSLTEYHIPTGHFANGIYMLKLSDKRRKICKKIMIQHER